MAAPNSLSSIMKPTSSRRAKSVSKLGMPRYNHDLMRPQFMKKGERISLNPFTIEEESIKTPLDLKAGKKFMPRVGILFGRRGAGKTLSLTTLLYIMKKRFEMEGSDRKIFTNYWTSFSDHSHPYLVDQLQEFPPWGENAIIGIDEIADILPSARAMSNYTVLTQGFFRQIRKRGCEIFAATQFPQEIPRGILRQVDWFVEAQLLLEGRAVRTYWHDWWGQWTGEYKRRYFPPERDQMDYSFTLWGTDNIWGHYRTEEVIASVYSDERDNIIARQYDSAGNPVMGGDTPEESAMAAAEPAAYKAEATFSEFLEMLNDNAGMMIRLEHLLLPARAELEESYMSEPKLRTYLVRQGYGVERDEEGEWVVFNEEKD